MGFSHVYGPDGLNNTLLPVGEQWTESAFEGQGGVGRNLWVGLLHGSTRGHVLSVTSANTFPSPGTKLQLVTAVNTSLQNWFLF